VCGGRRSSKHDLFGVKSGAVSLLLGLPRVVLWPARGSVAKAAGHKWAAPAAPPASCRASPASFKRPAAGPAMSRCIDQVAQGHVMGGHAVWQVAGAGEWWGLGSKAAVVSFAPRSGGGLVGEMRTPWRWPCLGIIPRIASSRRCQACWELAAVACGLDARAWSQPRFPRACMLATPALNIALNRTAHCSVFTTQLLCRAMPTRFSCRLALAAAGAGSAWPAASPWPCVRSSHHLPCAARRPASSAYCHTRCRRRRRRRRCW
jgi:hypothetical protein